MKKEALYIKSFTNASGSTSWRVLGQMPDGRRVRENSQDKDAASARLQELQNQADNIESSFLRRSTFLTEEKLREAERVFTEIKDQSLTDLVRFALENRKPAKKSITVQAALDLIVAEKEGRNRRGRTIGDLKRRISHIVKTVGVKKLISEIQPDDLRPLIFKPGRSNLANNGTRVVFGTFFKWALENKYCAVNPMEFFKPITIDWERPKILSVAQSRNLMEKAAEFEEGQMVPYFALALFAGIRPEELARLSWDCIDLEDGTISLSERTTKTRQPRLIEFASVTTKDTKGVETKLAPNIMAWLAPHALKRTPFHAEKFRGHFDAVRQNAGWGTGDGQQEWTQDIMRHTAISNHLAYFQHEGKTAEWAGNSPAVIKKHYKALVKQAAAIEFWGIVPDFSKIVDLHASEIFQKNKPEGDRATA